MDVEGTVLGNKKGHLGKIKSTSRIIDEIRPSGCHFIGVLGLISHLRMIN